MCARNSWGCPVGRSTARRRSRWPATGRLAPTRAWLPLVPLALLVATVPLATASAVPLPASPTPEAAAVSAWALGPPTVGALALAALASAAALSGRRSAGRARARAARLQTLSAAAFEGVVVHDGGVIVDANEAAARLCGLPCEALVGRPLAALAKPEGREALTRCVARPDVARCEVELLRPDGSTLVVELLSRPADSAGGATAAAAIRDLASRRPSENGPANDDPRATSPPAPPGVTPVVDQLRRALAPTGPDTRPVAVLRVSPDRIAAVRDAYGAEAAEALLDHVGRVLRLAVREGDTVARVGWDEFAILQVGPAQPEGAARLAERLVEVLEGDAALGGFTVETGASIGVAVFPDDDTDADRLWAKAGAALQRARAGGGAVFRLFDLEVDRRLKERRALEHDLREALATGGLALFYQPQADVRTGAVTGFEALLRWPHPSRGMVPPAAFIPLAEETGLIRQLGAWVLRAACAEAANWPGHLQVGVNLSPAQFARGDLAGLVERTLAQTGLPPERLELEITEGVLIDDPERVLGALNRLRGQGIRVSVDDFGAGYSSLGYLHRFPIDRIKIDRSFVTGLPGEASSLSILRAIVGLGEDLGMEVLAEGVETPEQLAALGRERCRGVQGYLIGRPLPAEAVLSYLAERAGGVDRSFHEVAGGDDPVALADPSAA